MSCQIGFARTGAAGSERGMEQTEEEEKARRKVRRAREGLCFFLRLSQADQPFSPLRATPRTI